MRCEYAMSTYHHCRGNGKAVTQVTVVYGKDFFGKEEKDILLLCAGCAEFVKKDAEDHGYTVLVQTI